MAPVAARLPMLGALASQQQHVCEPKQLRYPIVLCHAPRLSIPSRPSEAFAGLGQTLSSSKRFASPRSRLLRAAGGSTDWDLSDYVEAKVDTVRATDKYGHVIVLKLLNGQGHVLPVYVGDFECAALLKELGRKHSLRPMTHDLLKSTLDVLGYRVTLVRVTALVGNTYHARIHYSKLANRSEGEFHEVDVDARPSDALNMAVRFNAPVYVNVEVATKMAQAPSALEVREETHNEIRTSCRDEILRYNDPTVMHKLALQVAIANERYDEAAMLRDKIDRLLAGDRALSLVVAIETALDDERFEEAARLRDEFKLLRAERHKETQDA